MMRRSELCSRIRGDAISLATLAPARRMGRAALRFSLPIAASSGGLNPPYQLVSLSGFLGAP